MVKSILIVEGGAPKKVRGASEQHIRCRAALAEFFAKDAFGLKGPVCIRIAGSRDSAFKEFKRIHGEGDRVFFLVDSEDPVKQEHREKPWAHLSLRDGWKRPDDAEDEHVLLMTTCMETWIIADRETLMDLFHATVKDLPSVDLENRNRKDVLKALEKALPSYKKGELSFKILASLDPDRLAARLPAFERARRILRDRIPHPSPPGRR